MLPLIVSIFALVNHIEIAQYSFSIIFLALSEIIAAKTGGSNVVKGILKICFWDTASAMGITALACYVFGDNANDITIAERAYQFLK